MPLTVVQLLPALEVGGVERGCVEVAGALVRAGHRAIVVSAGGRLVNELRRAGAEHVELPIGAKRVSTLRHVRALRELLRMNAADIVHARSRLPAWIGWYALRGLPADARPAFVTTVHGPYTVNPYSAIMTRGERVIAISEFIRDYVHEHYRRVPRERVIVIHRGIDHDRYAHGYIPPSDWLLRWRTEMQVDDRFIVTLPARLTRWKGQQDFIEVIARLKARGVPVLGLMVGGAEPRREGFRQELEKRIARGGLRNDLRLLGDRRDLREILAVSDAAVSLTHEPEAFGRTTLEALTLGTPVIGYAHGATVEILRAIYPEGLCPAGDIGAAVELLAGLHAERQRVPAHNAFKLERMLAQTLEVYAAVAAERAGDIRRAG